jgi:hypothetical protein
MNPEAAAPSRRLLVQIERKLVEINPGKLNKERWAGKGIP